MFYARSILGQWVTGKGAIYRDFDKDKMVVDKIAATIILTDYLNSRQNSLL